MAVARFVFTSYSKSFSVYVENLEALSVEQIQEIESFVKNRKGLFDFTNYTFAIQKRLEFQEFVKLISLSDIHAVCIDKPVVTLQKDRVGFGQYKGMYYSELPNSYMVWLKTNYRGYDKEKVEKELQKRNL